MKRRDLIRATGGAVAGLSLAGCTGQEQEPVEEETPTAEGTTTEGTTTQGEETTADGEQTTTEAQEGIPGEIGETPDNLKVLKHNLYGLQNEQTGAGVKGAVKNVGDVPYTYVEVQVTLYDQTDDILGEFFDNTEESDISELAPGEKWNFDVEFDRADLGEAARYEVTVFGELAGVAQNREIPGEIGDVPDQLKVRRHDLYGVKNEDVGAGVSGIIENVSDRTYNFVEVQVTLYDETDDILGEFFDNTEQAEVDTLPPGNRWNFDVEFERADLGEAARYEITVTGEYTEP